jgi:hypothetical protein
VGSYLLWSAYDTFPIVDRSSATGHPEQHGEIVNGHDMLSQPLPDDALIVGLLGEATYLRYLQETEGLSQHVTTQAVPTDPEDVRIDVVEEALARGERPFLTRALPGAPLRWSLSALGPLIEVLPEPRGTVPEGMWPLELQANEAVTLAAWSHSAIAGSDDERITVAWRVETPIAERWKVSARLIGPDGSVLGQQDAVPVRNSYPTTHWRAGEIILDSYELPAPPPGAHYQLILYREEDGSQVGVVEWGE